jgi:hypothetical protein
MATDLDLGELPKTHDSGKQPDLRSPENKLVSKRLELYQMTERHSGKYCLLLGFRASDVASPRSKCAHVSMESDIDVVLGLKRECVVISHDK